MDPQKLQSFIKKAEDRLAGIRGSLLLFAQGRLSVSEIAIGHRKIEDLRSEASKMGLTDITSIAGECISLFETLTDKDGIALISSVNDTLDAVSKLEASLLQTSLGSDDFISDVNHLVDTSFENFMSNKQDDSDEWDEVDFEVDDETREIFRSEAEGLLANIATNLEILRNSPDDSNALWEIRRNAHTFKGAAGIIGFREASELSHRIEDLLDKMVESRCGADGRLIDLLTTSTKRLDEMASGKIINEAPQVAKALSDDFDKLIGSIPTIPVEKPSASTQNAATSNTEHIYPVAAPVVPVVRVSLDRLDDLLKLSRSLIVNHSELAAHIAEFNVGTSGLPENLKALIETHRHLSDEMQHGLLQIRMVRFGVLEMRLNRAVHVTCQEENKKAVVVIENADVEIDTLVIDALIEPLLHLLKNAVVHGIEPPETRRMLGKPEKGLITIAINADQHEVCLSVNDDGRGISSTKLIEKAINDNLIDAEKAASLDEQSIYQLIFQRGLTTAGALNMNAGRGVGMSIVKESVESRGGSVHIESEQQQGTKFTLRMPIALPTQPDIQPEPAEAPAVVESFDDDTPPLILIVDDSQSIRRMTAKIVKEAGFRSISADNGADALELLLSGDWKPDLILSDVEMPVMDGWDFLEYVKTDAHLSNIPVVMVTSLDTDEYRQKALSLGASDYLVKPFTVPKLDKVCETLAKVLAF